MFDRFGVGSPSPLGVREGLLVIGVHAVILAYGLSARTGHVDPPTRPIIDTMMFFQQAQHPGTSRGVPVVRAPGSVDITIPNIPTTIPTIPAGIGEPGPIAMPAAPIGSWPAQDRDSVYDSNVVEQPPELLSALPPRYPDLLRQGGIQGVVIVEAVVDRLGHAERSTLRVASSPNPAFSKSAIESIGSAVFRPGRVGGRAVRVLVHVPVRFTLSRG